MYIVFIEHSLLPTFLAHNQNQLLKIHLTPRDSAELIFSWNWEVRAVMQSSKMQSEAWHVTASPSLELFSLGSVELTHLPVVNKSWLLASVWLWDIQYQKWIQIAFFPQILSWTEGQRSWKIWNDNSWCDLRLIMPIYCIVAKRNGILEEKKLWFFDHVQNMENI